MHTELDAKSKRCCGPEGCGMIAVNQDNVRYCIASECLAWRWSYPPNEARGNKKGPQGYCGLAGEP